MEPIFWKGRSRKVQGRAVPEGLGLEVTTQAQGQGTEVGSLLGCYYGPGT